MSQNFYVPQMVFIDRKGVIQAQHGGTDPFLGDQQEANMRGLIERLLAEPGGTKATPTEAPAKSKAKAGEGIVMNRFLQGEALLACATPAAGARRFRDELLSLLSRCRNQRPTLLSQYQAKWLSGVPRIRPVRIVRLRHS